MNDTAGPESPNGRGAHGLFAKGNKIAGGNPVAKRMHKFRKALLDCATEGDVQTVARTLLALATAGDVSAIKLWLEYMIGKPAQSLELSGPDGEPLGISIEQIRTVLVQAVGDDLDARARLALALRALVRSTPDDPNDEECDS